MSIDDYKYIWETEKDDWVLVNTEYGYAIVNKRLQTVLCISDDALENAIISKMLASGNLKYNNINEAYSDI